MKGKLNKGYWLFFAVLLAVACAAIWFACQLIGGGVMTENGPMDKNESLFLGIGVLLIALSWLWSAFVMLSYCVKGVGFVMDENGISQTFVGIVLLAFMVMLPVKQIPWDAVVAVTKDENGALKLKLQTGKVKAPFLAKLILKMGYSFPICSLGRAEKEEWKTAMKNYIRCRIEKKSFEE